MSEDERWMDGVDKRLGDAETAIDRLREFQSFILGATAMVMFLLGTFGGFALGLIPKGHS